MHKVPPFAGVIGFWVVRAGGEKGVLLVSRMCPFGSGEVPAVSRWVLWGRWRVPFGGFGLGGEWRGGGRRVSEPPGDPIFESSFLRGNVSMMFGRCQVPVQLP